MLTVAYIVVALLAFLFGALAWWYSREDEKAYAKRQALAIAERVERHGDVHMVPLRLLAAAFDTLFGRRLLSWRVLWRGTSIAMMLLFLVLVWAGKAAGPKFVADPSSAIRRDIAVFAKALETDADQSREVPAELSPELAHYYQLMNERYRVLLAVMRWLSASTIGPSIYLAVLVSGVAMVVAASSIVALAITRFVLRSILKTSNPVLILFASFFNAAAGLAVATGSYVGVLVAAVPSLWLLVPLMPYVFWGSIMAGAFVVVFLTFMLTLAQPGPWVRFASTVAIYPSLTLITAVVLSCLLWPLSARIQSGVVSLLRRAAEHDKGPLAFIAVGVGLLAALTVVIVKVLDV